MCNLSECVFERGEIKGLAGAFSSMLSRGMTFWDAADLTGTPPDMAEKVRLYLENNKTNEEKK